LNLERQNRSAGIFVDESRLLVCAQGVIDNWNLYLQDRAAPQSGQSVGRALNKISDGKIKLMRSGQRNHYHVIDVPFLLEWAARFGIGNVDQMSKTLVTPPELPH